MSAQEVASILLKLKAISLSVDPPFLWTSGIRSPIYCDNRLVLSFPKERTVIVQGYVDLIEAAKLKPDVICGTATAGIPWAAWVADRLKLPLVYARKAAKEHGKGKQVEGLLKPGAKVLIVEDLISTGGSAIQTVDIIRGEEGVVSDVVAIFTYELEKSEITAKAANVKLHTLSDFTSLIKVAIDHGYLKTEEQKGVLDWAKDPEGWWYTREMSKS